MRALTDVGLLKHRLRDDGLSLVEVLIYSLLLVGVLAIVGSIMIGTLSIERLVRESTESTSAAQLAATSIEHGVRNATAVEVVPVGTDQVLLARTVGSDPDALTWRCEAWYFSASAGTIRHTVTSDDSTPVTLPTGEPTDWSLLANRIVAPVSGDIFTYSSNSVTIDFHSITEDTDPAVIQTTAVPRAGTLESASCF